MKTRFTSGNGLFLKGARHWYLLCNNKYYLQVFLKECLYKLASLINKIVSFIWLV